MPIENTNANIALIPNISNNPSKPNFFEQFGGFKAFSEKFNSIKQVAHAWQLGGVGYINNFRVDLEGTRFVDFREIFQANLQEFSKGNPDIISLEESEILNSLLNERSQEASLLFDDFQKGKPVSISSGFKGHRVIIAFDKDYLLIANKGLATSRPIELYKINPEKITQAAFEEIINLRIESEAKYNKWLSSISHLFDAKKDALSLCIEQAYPLSSYQEVGNCVWESLQTCVYGTLMLNRLRGGFEKLEPNKKITLIATSNKVFLLWKEFLQIQSLERFFRAHSPPSNPLPNLIENPKSLDNIISFEGLDQNILRNILRQFWSTKSTSIEFKHKMDNLESQYLKTLQGLALTYAKTEKLFYNHMSQLPYIVKDLATVWAPSALNTAIAVLSYALLPPTIKPEPKKLGIFLLLPAYSYSIFRTIQLARRHFAI